MDASNLKVETVLFPNNKQAKIVFPGTGNETADIVAELQLKKPDAVILVIGGADTIDEEIKPQLQQLFDRAVAKAAASTNAVIIDGGTQAGVMKLMGEGVANRGNETPLIGIAPAGMVSYPGSKISDLTQLDPNHTHFILPGGNTWGSETKCMFAIVKEIANRSSSMKGGNGVPAANPLPCVAILAGGGIISKHEVLYTIRERIPVIIFEGSGGVADDILQAWNNKETVQTDPLMAEIIEDGNLQFFSISNHTKTIERFIIKELGGDHGLQQAWETFSEYDLNANLQQKHFDRLQISIIVLGVLGTALAIIQQLFSKRNGAGELLFPWNVVKHTLILVPIVLTILITAANRFKQGTKWLLLRAGAESIKREIYRYRTHALNYVENAEQQLAKKIESITLRTMRTEVNMSALKPYDKTNGFPPYIAANDDGYSSLTPDQYVELRLNDQLRYFKRTTLKLARQLKIFSWATFIIGGIGTYLAAIDLQIWIALSTALVAAFGTYLGYRQTENTLTKYNQTATDLSNIKGWWNALSATDQAQQVNIDSLVEHTEKVLQSELDGWIQQMQNALSDLRKGQEAIGKGEKTDGSDQVQTTVVETQQASSLTTVDISSKTTTVVETPVTNSKANGKKTDQPAVVESQENSNVEETEQEQESVIIDEELQPEQESTSTVDTMEKEN